MDRLLAGQSTAEAEWLHRELGRQRLGLTDLILSEILQGLSNENAARRFYRELSRFEIYDTGGEELAVATARNFRLSRQQGRTVRKTIFLLHDDRDYDHFEHVLGLFRNSSLKSLHGYNRRMGVCDPTVTKPNVLLTNDDGYQAAGLRAVAEELKNFANVSIVAPSSERSGAAQSLTLRQPIVCHPIAENEWAVDGTPADCVIVALHKLLKEPRDLVISGINHGANLGENVYYSGTVGAAREAVIHHVPGLALSLCSKKVNRDFAPTARLARKLAELILSDGLQPQVVLNVNVPEGWEGGIRFTRQSQKITRDLLREGQDPRGRPYYWLSEQRIDREKDVDPESDYAAIFAGDASITPLHLDPTHAKSLLELAAWTARLKEKQGVL